MKLVIVHNTHLESRINEERISLSASAEEYALHSYKQEGNYYKVAFLFNKFNGKNTWWVPVSDVKLIPDTPPSKINLDVPYLSQRDNVNRPSGTCNITSVACVLKFYNIKPRRNDVQFEDLLFEDVKKKGWDRHLHSDLVKLFKLYNVKDVFNTNTSFEQVKLHLAKGNPVIYSGRLTASGHIITIRGYDDSKKVWYVNDSWGEWSKHGYINKSGENLEYSYNLLSRLSYTGPKYTWAHLPKL